MALPLSYKDFIEIGPRLFAIRYGPFVYVLGESDFQKQLNVGAGSGISMRCLIAFSAYDTKTRVCGEVFKNRVKHAVVRDTIDAFRRQYCKTVNDKDLHKHGLHFTGVKRLVHHHK